MCVLYAPRTCMCPPHVTSRGPSAVVKGATFKIQHRVGDSLFFRLFEYPQALPHQPLHYTMPAKQAKASHPTYAAMIAEAIAALKERGGSSRAAIAKWVNNKYKGKYRSHTFTTVESTQRVGARKRVGEGRLWRGLYVCGEKRSLLPFRNALATPQPRLLASSLLCHRDANGPVCSMHARNHVISCCIPPVFCSLLFFLCFFFVFPHLHRVSCSRQLAFWRFFCGILLP